MLAGISVFCFAASYAVALLLEATRPFFRSGLRGILMLGFTGAGLLAHTLFLGYRAFTAESAPLSSPFDWYLLAAWTLVCVYLISIYSYPKVPLGLFILPLVLGLIGMAEYSSRQPFAQHPAAQVWGPVHGVFLLLGYVAVIVGFVAGLMYLLQSRRLKRKVLPSNGLKLPSLERLERINSRAIVLSALFVGLGFVSGIVLNAVSRGRGLDSVPWTDPVIWRLGSMLLWLCAAALFSSFYKPAQRGRKVAYLTVASFCFLAVSVLLFRALLDSEHDQKVDRAVSQQTDIVQDRFRSVEVRR
ncbi:MAG: cytochrome c biogenesis protein CcsA [Planctomycetota bacterium]|nr:cytochrome c biogenesis protein CcsA [Planctomycetota bacterium]